MTKTPKALNTPPEASDKSLETCGLRILKAIRRIIRFATITDAGKEITQSAPSLLQERFSDALHSLPEFEQEAIALAIERVGELMEDEHFDTSSNLILNSQIDDKGEQS